MEAETEVYGFSGELDSDQLSIADSCGGGRRFSISQPRDDLIAEIAEWMRFTCSEFAEEIVDELLEEA